MKQHGRRLTAAAVAVTLAVIATGCAGDDDGAASPPSDTSARTTSTRSRPADCPDAELPPDTPLGDATLLWTDDCIPFVRTPDAQFADLDGFPYEAQFADVGGLRMAYVDEGPAGGETLLLLHGEPSWGYLYRKMIPTLVDAGYRVVVPDLIGMGRSDKPVQLGDYTYLRHVAWVERFLDELALDDVTAFVQDWGSLIGLRVIGNQPDRFARVVVANGRLPVIPEGLQVIQLPDPPRANDEIALPITGDGTCTPVPGAAALIPGLSECFPHWAAFALTGTQLRASDVIEAITATTLTEAELAAYDAPFPERIYMTGPRVFPSLINTLGEAPTNAAARAVFDGFEKPLLTLFGRLDETLGSEAVQAEMRDRVPGAQGQAHHAYDDANHFIQEDKGEDLAARVVAFMRANPLPTG